MGFLGVYRAIYNYVPQGESELAITEGDILYVLEKSGEDDWWRAKKKASGDDDDEPVGLIPNNYIEEAQPSHHARALYDYTRQTDEELSFTEDTKLEVFDTSDPDWILVGHDDEYGFAPSNYISILDEASTGAGQPPAAPRRQVSDDSTDGGSSRRGPAAALAGVINQRKPVAPPPNLALPPRPQYTPEASDDESAPTPSLPARPGSQSVSSRTTDYPTPSSPISPGVAASPPNTRSTSRSIDNDSVQRATSGFTVYDINEMVSILGKRKKMPTALGINLTTGTIMIASDKARDGPSQEWTAEKMTHHSIEGKHVFIELVRPSKSVDLHAGTRDTAEEIDAALAEIASAIKAEGLHESLTAGSGQGQKKGVMLYDFMAQGDDEVSVAIDDEVIVLDSKKSDEWWMVRRVKNGKEGVVPSSYVEITGTVAPTPSTAGINAGRSTVEQNRLEEQRLAKESLKAAKREEETRGSEVGPGLRLRLPERGSSLKIRDNSNTATQPRIKRENRQPDAGQPRSSKSKPDPTKVRTWTDRSKSFSVEAQFLALKDGKINLHKMNGVKIAVPVVKMSVEDLEYVERITGISLDEDKPLSEGKTQKPRSAMPKESSTERRSSPPTAGVTIEKRPNLPDYDWFTFFLACDVSVALCERYAQIFSKDSMDESVLPDVDSTVLRTLGIREGDIIKVMRYLDGKYNRTPAGPKRSVSFGSPDGGVEDAGGLFSGPGGALRNNTRKGRPAPAIQTNDVIDPKAFSQDSSEPATKSAVSESVPTPLASAPVPAKKAGASGFDDDAWDVKPAKQQAQRAIPQPAQSTASPAPAQLALAGSMYDLSLLDTPLQPTKAQPAPPAAQPQPIQQQSQQQSQQTPQQILQQIPQPTGATPAFFAGVGPQVPSLPAMHQDGSFTQNPQFVPQQTGYAPQQQSQQSIARQRPIAPQFTQNQSSLMVPPPPRPLSAPQAPQQNTFGPPPLQPQRTGIPNSGVFNTQLAPPGQSLAEISQLRLQQQYIQQQQQLQQQLTGFGGPLNNFSIPQPQGYGQPNGFGPQIPQQTGFLQNQTFQNGQGGSPFSDPRTQQFSPVQTQPTGQFSQIQTQPTGFQSSFGQQQFPQQTGINSFLPPAMQPQQTGALAQQQPGLNGFGQNFGQPPVLPAPQQQSITPLLPQKTGPPPPVRFGVSGDSKKLMPQATGRRANLAQSTPQNPFGF